MILHNLSREKISTCAVGKCTQLRKIENIAEKFQELHLLKTVSVLVKPNEFYQILEK